MREFFDALPQGALRQICRGIEKENLRMVCGSSAIALTAHPRSLGSALTHPMLTTDFAESLLEIVTPPLEGIDVLGRQLDVLDAFVYQRLRGEYLWPASMPPVVDNMAAVALASYGGSHIGQMKHIYRRGLLHRYGKAMQLIAGIHFNFSFPVVVFELLAARAGYSDVAAVQSDYYMALVRFFWAHYWILPYLFGASPVVARTSVVGEVPDWLVPLCSDYYYAPNGTSLRNSQLGYQNSTQSAIRIDYSGVDAYACSLGEATRVSHAPFEAIGVSEGGVYCQLNANLLQIENEYYSPIRPKQVAHSGEKPSLALARRGVAYIEVRALDLDPFEPRGVGERAMRFMDVFMLQGLLASQGEVDQRIAVENFNRVVVSGRDAGCRLRVSGRSVLFCDAAHRFLDRLFGIAELMDAHVGGGDYADAVMWARSCVDDPDRVLSARVLAALSGGRSYGDWCIQLGEDYRRGGEAYVLGEEAEATLDAGVEASLAAQQQIEASDDGSFDAFLANYFAQ